MRKMDFYWASNKDWYYRDEHFNPHIKSTAPKEAKESFQHYLEQLKKSEEAMKNGAED